MEAEQVSGHNCYSPSISRHMHTSTIITQNSNAIQIFKRMLPDEEFLQPSCFSNGLDDEDPASIEESVLQELAASLE